MTADDLTRGTPRPARVGDTVHTDAELEALPAGSVVLPAGIETVVQRTLMSEPRGEVWHQPGEVLGWASAAIPLPATVLFRPDAPQPGYAELHASTGCTPPHHTAKCQDYAPQPVTENSAPAVLASDDAVERAARAWHQEAERQSDCQMGEWDALDPDDRARALRRMRAALAAAGAGAEVGRAYPEVECPGMFIGWSAFGATYPDTVCATSLTWPEGHDPGPVLCDADDDHRPKDIPCPACDPQRFAQYEDDPTAPLVVYRLTGLLAARGDATPTEVEWGVRYTYPHPEPDAVYPVPDEATARALVDDDESTATRAMQRDVHRSAWREVEGGEQRA